LINSSLQSLVQKLVQGETQNVIELEFLIGKQAISMHSVEESSAFEQSSGILFFESKQLSGCFSEAREEEMDSPDLSLVLEAVFADQLQFVIDSFLLERSPGGVEGRGV